MKKLTLAEQRAMVRAIPKSVKMAMKRECEKCQMKGMGLKDIFKKIRSVFEPVVKAIGPTVLRELVVPFVKKKVGLGKGKCGGSLYLPGQ